MPQDQPYHYRMQKIFMTVAGICLLGMIFLIMADIVARLFFTPILGAVELLGLMGAVVASFALGYTQVHGGHLAIDIVVERLMMRRVTRRFNNVIFSLFFLIVGFYLLHNAWILIQTGELTETLLIIFYPFIIATALGFFSLCTVLLMDLWNPPESASREDQK